MGGRVSEDAVGIGIARAFRFGPLCSRASLLGNKVAMVWLPAASFSTTRLSISLR